MDFKAGHTLLFGQSDDHTLWQHREPKPDCARSADRTLSLYRELMTPLSLARRDDLVDLYIEALQNSSFDGTYNATAPNPVRMSELCSSLGRVIGRPSWLPVPEFALQVLLSPLPFACCPFLLPFSSGLTRTLPLFEELQTCSSPSHLCFCSLPFVTASLCFATGFWLGSAAVPEIKIVCMLLLWMEVILCSNTFETPIICLCIVCVELLAPRRQESARRQ